jgi:hypothetical protein
MLYRGVTMSGQRNITRIITGIKCMDATIYELYLHIYRWFADIGGS